MSIVDPLRGFLRYLFSFLFLSAGFFHLIAPEFFEPMMPPYIPAHTEMIYATGVLEMVGGVCLMSATLQRWAAWGLIAYLAAVLPVHVYMYQEEIYVAGMPQEPWALQARIALQFVMMGLLYFCGASSAAE